MTSDSCSLWEHKETYRSKTDLVVSNLPHLSGNEQEFNAVVTDTEVQLAKEDEGWSWKDVTSIFPISDFWAPKPILRPRSSIHRHEYMISASADQVYQALIHTINRFEIMRSIAVERTKRTDDRASSKGVPFANSWFAILRLNTPGLVEQRITILEVDSIEEEMDRALQDDYNDGTRVQPPGALVHFTIVKSAKEPKKCGLLYQIHHAIFDMTSLSMFLDSIEDVLTGRAGEDSADPPMSYGPYAFWRYTLPWTSQGQANIDYNVKLLTGVSQNGVEAQWPPKRAKGFMRGNDKGWFGEDKSERIPLGPTDSTQRGLSGDWYATRVPGIHQLRSQHNLSAAKVVKAAQILFNVWKTGAKEAIFGGAEGGRMVAGMVPSSLDMRKVPGEVAEGSLTRFSVASWDESTLDLLHRVQQDQIELSAHYPLHRGHLQSALPKKDQDYLAELGARQIFNWAPKVPNQRNKIKLMKFEGRSDVGLSWTYRMSALKGEEDVLIVEASWDNCQMTLNEVQLATKQLLSAAKWLSNQENIHKPIKECIFDPSTSYEYHPESSV